jgi:uncharacterized GH25 family protein
MTLGTSAIAAALGLIFGAAGIQSQLGSHEFIIKPAQSQVEDGAKLPFSITATHFFFVSEEVEPVDTVKVWLIEADNTTPIRITENHILNKLDGVAKMDRKGTVLLVAHLQEPIESISGEGSTRSQIIKRETFAKALITVSANDESYKKVIGRKLEVVPVANLMSVRVGDALTFKILLDGKPLKGQVFATYDGFSRRHMTFATATETLADGLAYVKITSPETWMVRVEKRIDVNTKEFDLLSLKATLVFSVQ